MSKKRADPLLPRSMVGDYFGRTYAKNLLCKTNRIGMQFL